MLNTRKTKLLNFSGKVIKCSLQVLSERKKVRVFYKMFQTKCVITTQYFNDVKQEVSETFFTPEGKIVLHYWHGYNYLLHSVKAPVEIPEKILPKLELMWRSDKVLLNRYELEKKLNYDNAIDYLMEHPEASDFLHDYILSLLKYKPDKVLEFTIKFFQNMKNNY